MRTVRAPVAGRWEFDRYVAERGHGLERYAYALTGDHAAAQDLVQNALIKAYRRWRRIGTLEFPDAYVRKILTNCFLDERRRQREQPLGVLPEQPVPDGSGQFDDRDAVIRALVALTPQQRAATVLRHFLGLDDAVIAAELGCSEGTVRTHVSRALVRMRAHLELEGPSR